MGKGLATQRATGSGHGSRSAGPLSRNTARPCLVRKAVWPGSCRRWIDPTRLETRTKESNMCASVRAANPDAQRNRESLSPSSGAWLAERYAFWLMPSKSTYVGTRKMVNYACAG